MAGNQFVVQYCVDLNYHETISNTILYISLSSKAALLNQREKNPDKNFTGLSLSSRPKEREQCHDDTMRQRV